MWNVVVPIDPKSERFSNGNTGKEHNDQGGQSLDTASHRPYT
jgi:hypothetical protein